jgi:hypothetical protein
MSQNTKYKIQYNENYTVLIQQLSYRIQWYSSNLIIDHDLGSQLILWLLLIQI